MKQVKPDVTPSVWSADGDRYRVTIGTAHTGARVDLVLAAATGLSRAAVQHLIDDGHAHLAGVSIRKASYRVRPGDVIDLDATPSN